MKDLNELTKRIIAFRNERDWKQFHNPKDVALTLVLEAAEVMEQAIDLFFTSGDAEVRMQGPNKVFRVTRGERIVRGCLAKIEFK